MNEALLILVQGSFRKYPESLIGGIWDNVNRTAKQQWVELCCTDGDPAIGDSVETLVAYGAKSIVIAPLLMFDEQTDNRMLMTLLGQLVALYPSVTFRLTAPVGIDIEIAARVTAAAQRVSQSTLTEARLF